MPIRSRAQIPAVLLLSVLGPTLLGAAAQEEPADRDLALRQAAQAGDFAAVRELLAADVDPNVRSTSGGSPLMFAAYGDHVDVVNALRRHGRAISTSSASWSLPARRRATPATRWAWR